MRVGGPEVNMNLKRLYVISVVILIPMFLSIHPAFSQARKEVAVSYQGYIESVLPGPKMISVNETPVYLSFDTKLFDVKGGTLRITDLKPGMFAKIEGVQKTNGVYARKISIRTPNKKWR